MTFVNVQNITSDGAVKLTVVVPAYNEEQNIVAVVNDLIHTLSGELDRGSFEVILVDDGSTDGTGKVMEDFARESGRIRVVHHETKQGLGAAVSKGYSIAEGDYVSFIPGDGQVEASQLTKLFQQMRGADLIVSGRRGVVNWHRRVLTFGWHLLTRFLLGFDPKGSEGIYIIRRELLKVLNLKSKTGMFNLEIPIRCFLHQYDIRQGVTEIMPRLSGKSKVTDISTIVRTIRDIFKLRSELLKEYELSRTCLGFPSGTKHISVLPGFLVVLVIAILLVPLRGTVSVDATSNDLLEALRITRGEMIERIWRPVVYATVAAALLLWGVSVKSSLLVTRFFYAANICMTYAMSARMYGVAIGLIASFLTISSFGINSSASFPNPVDTMTPFFILCFLLALYCALESTDQRYAILAGILLGLSCLTKEVSIPYVILPLIVTLAVKRYRLLGWQTMLGKLYASFGISYGAWFLFATIVTGKPSWFLGDAAPWAVERVTKHLGSGSTGYQMLVTALLWEFPQNALKYYRDYLVSDFNLAPLLILGVSFVVARAVYLRRGADVVIASSILLYLPSVVIQAVVGERLGHGMPIFYLGYIALAVTIVDICDWLVTIKPSLEVLPIRLHTLVAAILITAQWLGGSNATHKLLFGRKGGPNFGKVSFYQGGPFVVEGRLSSDIEEAAGWVRDNVRPGSRIVVDGATKTSMDVLTGLSYPMDTLSTVLSADEVKERLAQGQLSSGDRVLLCVPSPKFFSRNVRRYRVLFFVFERELLESIERSNARYLVIGPYRLFVSLYLDATPWAKVRFRNSEVSIYELERGSIAPLSSWRLVTANVTPQVLSRLEQNFPAEYAELEELLREFNLSTRILDENTYDNFQRWWVGKHIRRTAAIIYSSPDERFVIPEWKDRVFWFDKDRLLESLRGYDYLLLHSQRRVSLEYPELLKDLRAMVPWKVFPHVPYWDFGEGWEIYRLPWARQLSYDGAGFEH